MSRRHAKGFTLVEMLVVAPVVILAIGAFLAVIINMTGEVLASRAANVLTYTSQDALLRIEDDIKQSTTFLATTADTIPFAGTNPQGFTTGSTGSTTPFTNVGLSTGPALLLNMIATDKNPATGTARAVYLNNAPNPCGANQAQNRPLTYIVAYFTKEENGISSLWRRTIMPTQYNSTGTNGYRCGAAADLWQIPSCRPPFNTLHAFCRTNDEKLVDNIAPNGFSISYFRNASEAYADPASLNASVSTRTTALQANTSAKVEIHTLQTVAGREVKNDASVRVARLDTNASTIADLQDDTTRPAQPNVTATTSNPTTATFNWSSVVGATGYRYTYTINGGGSTSGTVGPNTRSFSVTNATHADVVQAQVVALKSTAPTGSNESIASTSSVTIPQWAGLELQNNWNNYGNEWGITGYTKTSSGLVMLSGMIARSQGTNTAGETLFVLPPGYRPAISAIYRSISNGNTARIDILTSGEVRIQGTGHGPWITLSGINFYPSGNTFTNASGYSNGWNTRPGAPWVSAASYYHDTTAGRVEIRGMLNAGTTTDNTTIWTMPSNLRPPQYMHLTAMAADTHTTVGVYADGRVVAKGDTNSSNWFSIHNIYPVGRASGTTCTTQWCNLTLQNSWANYGGEFTTAQYTKASDNVVSLKGLIRAGSTGCGTIMTTLPAGYRPSKKLLFDVRTHGGLGRADVNPDGTVTFCGGTNPWFSLDGINFLAE